MVIPDISVFQQFLKKKSVKMFNLRIPIVDI